ncbi:MAG: hypothetical protein HRU69_12140 [Flammeovirgaceae bacterium]|nr:MAG: hypothetical protein HRU69_12140 [Flammeovirgaceae bacterium]
MEKLLKFLHTVPGVALVTALLLLVPLIAMQFTTEVQWSVFDFIVMGILVFGTGVVYVLVTRHAPGLINRVAVASAIGSTFLLVWANLAVGLIGGGPNPGNLMYIGVVAVIIIGTYLSRFTAKGMEHTMLAASGSIVLVAILALLTGMQHYPGSSVGEIIGVNAFFAGLFAVSGLLFRYIVISEQSSADFGK